MIINISQNLRPLKLAFVIKPNDFPSLAHFIAVKSFLWGGRFNPILPFYTQTPLPLRQDTRRTTTKALFYGNLLFFQPDFLVLGRGIDETAINTTHCDILRISDITNNLSYNSRPGYGLGLFDILPPYYESEEKFIRKEQINYFAPSYGRHYRSFLSSIFGTFPQEVSLDARNYLLSSLTAETLPVTMQNYLQIMESDLLPIHTLSSYKTEIDYTGDVPRDRYIIYYLDPNSFLDIITYINLKAAGYSVLPITREIAQTEGCKASCLNFINAGSWVHPQNPHAMTHVILQKSPSIKDIELDEFYSYLSPPHFPTRDWPRCLRRHFLPPFWSQFHQERGEVHCVPLTAAKSKDEVPLLEGQRVAFSSLAPSFLPDGTSATGKPRYAIDIAIQRFGSKTFDARIIPSGSVDVAASCGMANRREWLIKNSTITYLASYDFKIFFQLPNAVDVFLGWLTSGGWDAKVSDAGKVAYQMLRHLDGPWSIGMLKSRKFIEYFSGKSFNKDRGVDSTAFMHQVKREIYPDLPIIWGEEKFFRSLLESRVVQLGVNLQCDVCARYFWRSIKFLDYTIQCPHCLSDFELPAHDPRKIKWAYKTIGPFAAPGRSAGAYSVLLTAHFFQKMVGSSGGTTVILSFEAIKSNSQIEADLGLFYKGGAFFERTLETIFCECKTFNQFTKADVEKMRIIARAFPGAILVFATLNDCLSKEERALVTPFVKFCNKYHERDRPINPVLVLTANELFADAPPPYAWRDKIGKYEQFCRGNNMRGLLDLCCATQQIYLDLDPWHVGWQKVWERKRSRRSVKD